MEQFTRDDLFKKLEEIEDNIGDNIYNEIKRFIEDI